MRIFVSRNLACALGELNFGEYGEDTGRQGKPRGEPYCELIEAG